MARFIAPFAAVASAPLHKLQAEILRGAIVCGCGLALIAAGSTLSF